MSKMKLSAGEPIWYWEIENDKIVSYGPLVPKGFSALGMHVEGRGIWPFFTERSWYAAGFAQGYQFIYLKHQWMLSRVIVFEMVRLERWGRIFFWEQKPVAPV